MFEGTNKEAARIGGLSQPKETLFLKYVSTITGHTYDEEMVDHLADMLLIFYTAGGTACGAVVGCAASLLFLQSPPTLARVMLIAPAFAFLGAATGCAMVLLALNLRGLIRWDRYEFKRTISLRQSLAKQNN